MTTGTLYVGFARVLRSFSPPPTLGHHPSLQTRQLQQSSSKVHINPSVLIIIIILSVLFICSGVLHILARCLGLRRARPAAGGFISPSISIRGQLQHLFSLHDSGVKQVVIDTLPTFLYGSSRGLKDSADCSVCLIEFANEDRLRLLPKCKHAFHLDCIDTWLLSNSTCPLCRRSLLPEAESAAPPIDGNGPAASSEDSQGASRSQRHGSFRGSSRLNLRGSFRFLTDAMAPSLSPPSFETDVTPIILNPAVVDVIQASPLSPGPTVCVTDPGGSEKVLQVELGKVNTDPRRIARDTDNSLGPRSNSMGSYEYVVSLTRLGLAMPSKPTHKTSLSDTTPDRVRASYAPGQEDTFLTRRDSDSPHRLSMVMETTTPSPRWLSSPTVHESQTSLSRLQQHELATTSVSQPVTDTPHNEHRDSTAHETPYHCAKHH